MNREILLQNLNSAAKSAIVLARKYVTETLPDEYHFLIRVADDTSPPKKRLFRRGVSTKRLVRVNPDQVIAHYWREGKYPPWFTLEVITREADSCGIVITSEGALVDNDDRVKELDKIKKNGHPPFSAAIVLPPFIEDPENFTEDQKFSLYWRQHHRVSLWRKIEFFIVSSRFYALYWKWRYPRKD